MEELVLDFETIWCHRAKPLIPERQPKDRSDPAEKLAFDPNFIRPCVAGFCDGEKTWSFGLNDFLGENPEAQLLQAIWDEIETVDRIVTFNGWSFDLPLLLRRSWYLGIAPSKFISLKKYESQLHIDVRMVLANWDSYARGSLDLYARLKLGLAKKDGIDGSQVQAMWDAGKYAEVKAYCEQDCRITWDLYQSLKGWYLP